MCKRSFTLAEVLITILIVGGAFALFLPAIKGATDSYLNLRLEGTCRYLADEYFAREVLDLLSKETSKEIEHFSKKFIVKVEKIEYLVTVSLKPEEENRDEEEKEKFMVILQVAVIPAMKVKEVKNEETEPQGVKRETKLCIAIQK